MRKTIKENINRLKTLYDLILITDKENNNLVFDEAIETAVNNIIQCKKTAKKLIFIGNGASASIASHMATDFWKNGNVRALAFNDASGLTCISNDFGYKHVFEKPVEMFSNSGDILVAISSSGRSENILRAAKAAKANNLKIITLSGFSEDNPLRIMGDINFYIPSDSYGHIEVLHHSICHCLVDTIIKVKNG
jgi:D-sedoheptulose 7-phosphate isomerase